MAGESSSDEWAIVDPTSELLDYVSMLRKIERDPANAPVMSAAVRYLERARKNKAKQMLDLSRRELGPDAALGELSAPTQVEEHSAEEASPQPYNFAEFAKSRRERSDAEEPDGRRTISELLHDIYDEREG